MGGGEAPPIPFSCGQRMEILDSCFHSGQEQKALLPLFVCFFLQLEL